MFNDKYGLTEAVLKGRKTQTRRVVTTSTIAVAKRDSEILGGDIKDRMLEHSRYLAGEVVAVAQSYINVSHEVFLFSTKVKVRGRENRAGWENKMFVRAELMPHHIRISNVRIERLQDISDEDCLAEGVEKIGNFYHIKNYLSDEWEHYSHPQGAYAALIDKISGKGTWESNPWVFVIDFDLVD